MLAFSELTIQNTAPTNSPVADLYLLTPDGEDSGGFVRVEECRPGPDDQPGWFGRLFGATPRSVRRSVVRTGPAGQVVLALQYFPPVFHEVDRVIGPDGELVGRCISFAKHTLRAGFRIEYADRRPFGEVPFTRPGADRFRLLAAGSGSEVGVLLHEGDSPTTAGARWCYRLTAGASASTGVDYLFLLAAGLTFGLADLRLQRSLGNVNPTA